MKSRGMAPWIVVAAMGAGAFVPGSSAEAGTIKDPGTVAGGLNPSGPGLGSMRVVAFGNPSPNNDNVAGKTNFISLDGQFDKLGYIDIVLEVVNSNGVTEYQYELVVRNATGAAWTGFRFELGFGTGANFVKSNSALDFDTPDKDPAPFGLPFKKLDHTANTLDWSDGRVEKGKSVTPFLHAIDVPDFDAAKMPKEAKTDDGYKFTLRAIPIPEPSSWVLTLTGLAATCLPLRRLRMPRPAS